MAQTYDAVASLNELIADIEFAILTTVHPDGTLHSCPMAAQPADSDGILWFITNIYTDKVEAVRTSPRVNVAYANSAAQHYISVSGYCELVRDRPKTQELWKPAYKAWFPRGLDDPDLILLKINVLAVEYWDSAQAGMVLLPGFDKPRMM